MNFLITLKGSPPVKTTQQFFILPHKHGSLALSINIFKKNLSKNEVSLHLKQYPTPCKKIGNIPTKRGVSMVLFYVLLQNISVELHIVLVRGGQSVARMRPPRAFCAAREHFLKLAYI